jgi:hypothetical protein
MGIIAGSRLRAAAINPIFDNAAAYYKMEETTGNLIDSVNSHNGVLFGDITRGITGIIDNGYEFQGTNNSRVKMPSSIYDDFDNDNYTVSFWFRSSSSAVEVIIDDLSSVIPTAFARRKLAAFIQNGRVVCAFGDNGSSEVIISSVFTTNQWNLFQIKYDINNQIKSKLNNVLQGTYTFIDAPQNTSNIFLGSRVDSNFPYTGELDEISFINGQTTDQQDTELWNNGNGITY